MCAHLISFMYVIGGLWTAAIELIKNNNEFEPVVVLCFLFLFLLEMSAYLTHLASNCGFHTCCLFLFASLSVCAVIGFLCSSPDLVSLSFSPFDQPRFMVWFSYLYIFALCICSLLWLIKYILFFLPAWLQRGSSTFISPFFAPTMGWTPIFCFWLTLVAALHSSFKLLTSVKVWKVSRLWLEVMMWKAVLEEVGEGVKGTMTAVTQ